MKRRKVTKHRKNPAYMGERVNVPYPFAKKEDQYQDYSNERLVEALREAVRFRDAAEAHYRIVSNHLDKITPAFRAAEKEFKKATEAVEESYIIAGWYSDDVHTLAKERNSREARLHKTLAGLKTNPRKRCR